MVVGGVVVDLGWREMGDRVLGGCGGGGGGGDSLIYD